MRSSMARMISKEKTSSVTCAITSAPSLDPAACCRDLDNWPRSWMGLEKDVLPGEQLLACFRPFIAHLASSSLSRKTIRKHVDNLWMLGGEIIREIECGEKSNCSNVFIYGRWASCSLVLR